MDILQDIAEPWKSGVRSQEQKTKISALRTAENFIAREMAKVSNPDLEVGSQAFLQKVADILQQQSPELLERARDMVNAPQLFGADIGFNLPAFCIALIITTVLVIGIRESGSPSTAT